MARTIMHRLSRNRCEYMIELFKQVGLFPNPSTEGFSAFRSAVPVSQTTQIDTWSDAAPYFSSTNFNTTTGDYTVPVTGIYALQATVNYNTDAAITTTLADNINPAFEIRRTSGGGLVLASGLLPIVNLDLNLGLVVLVIRAVLGSGAVTVTELLKLTVGDVIGLFYNADGMTIGLTLSNIDWMIYQIS